MICPWNSVTVPTTASAAESPAITRSSYQPLDLVEDLGSDANVYGHAAMDGGSERFVVRTDRRSMPTMGETVYIKPQANQVHVFNASSGARI